MKYATTIKKLAAFALATSVFASTLTACATNTKSNKVISESDQNENTSSSKTESTTTSFETTSTKATEVTKPTEISATETISDTTTETSDSSESTESTSESTSATTAESTVKDTAATSAPSEPTATPTAAPTTAETTKAPASEDKTPTKAPEATTAPSSGSNKKLSTTGSGYEGIKATTDYNYGQALQMSILFYELQRSGDLPDSTRCNWRGDSCVNDGSDVGIDLSGGLYDAGDHVKFNLPMAYSGALLGWSVYEDKEAYEKSGQLPYILDNIKWISDYLIKCHPEDEVYYYQVGNGGTDHSWWGPVEVINMDRPSYKVTKDNPGSAVTGEAAACLAITSIIYKDVDPSYSKLCLEHAESLYKFANSTKSDSGYTAADGFYNSWSGFYDELAWAGSWLYIATNNSDYLTNAENCYTKSNQDYDWSMCWDDVHIGAAVMLAKLTNKDTYKKAVEQHLDFWSCGTSDGKKITYTPKGLAWLDSWGSLRYATTTAFIASVYSEWDGCPNNKVDTYWNFALSQAQYALGSSGFSYQIGYGDAYPEHPHHRTSQGSYCDNMNEPGTARHVLYGALVGGPDASDGYTDTVSNYNTNEVACDYNAGFTGLLANMYSRYYGETLKDFGAVEPVGQEYFVEGSVNVSGDDFVEMRTFVYNETAWPARTAKNVEYRYFVNLSEVYEAGGSSSNIEVTTNYMQNGSCNGLYVWDEDAHIYYVSVTFTDGSLAPRGQSNYKAELQIRMRSTNGKWDNSNDPSFASLNGSNPLSVALYENGKLVYGSEPGEGGATAGTSVTSGATGNSGDSGNGGQASQTTQPTQAPSNPASAGGSASSGDLTIEVKYDSIGASANSISGTIDVKNDSGDAIDISKLTLNYYLKNTSGKTIIFDCYHSAINGADGSYTQLTGVSGSIDKVSGGDADTCVAVKYGSGTLYAGGKVTLSFALHYEDWSVFDSSDDHSAKSIENIVVESEGKVIYGKMP